MNMMSTSGKPDGDAESGKQKGSGVHPDSVPGTGSLQHLLDILADPPASRRPIPFWSWNDRLEEAPLKEQAAAMAARGMGGFFMHARGGLETEYLGKEWMQCVRSGIETARHLGTEAWLYDEEGWPSGFAGGIVPGMGEQYQGRWLTIHELPDLQGEDGKVPAAFPDGGRLLKIHEGHAICEHLNPDYIDVLSPEAVDAFILNTHERYRQSLGESFKNLRGFFTDEPRFSGSIDCDIPWSPILPARFREACGYDLLEHLQGLFLPTPGHEALRYDFWKLVNSLFVSSFMERIHAWCKDAGCELTGHVMMEESIYVQMANTGGVMPFYAHMDMPGIDWLRRGIGSPVVPRQVSSVAAQLGKNRILTESFALCGWDASLEELRWIAHWQYVNGVTMLCQHLSAYSLRGFRKRDYPPSLFHQQPWWDRYGMFNDYISRLGLLLSEGELQAPVLLIHPVRSGWIMYDGQVCDSGFRKLDEDFVAATMWLSGSHLGYHLGDETIIHSEGSVEIPSGTGSSFQEKENGQRPEFRVGKCTYSAIALPSCRCLASETMDLLLRFAMAGGTLVHLGEFPSLVDGRPDCRCAVLKSFTRSVDIRKEHARQVFWREARESISLERTGSGYGNPELRFHESCVPHTDMSPHTGNEASDIHVATRISGSLRIMFLANLDREAERSCHALIPWRGKVRLLDLTCLKMTRGGARQLPGGGSKLELNIPAMGGMVVLVDTDGEPDGEPYRDDAMPEDARLPASGSSGIRILKPDPDWNWTLESVDPNALTLDSCSYRIDDGEWMPEKPVLSIQSELIALRRPCRITLQFSFFSELPAGSGDLKLVLESPRDFTIQLNGCRVPGTDCGSWKDASFRCIDMAGLARYGMNTLTLERYFYQSGHVYHVLLDEGVYETEKNRLTCDVELESIYLIGKFGVACDSPFSPGPRNSTHTAGPFRLVQMPEQVHGGDLGPQGFPFFSGAITLTRDLGPAGNEPEGLVLDLGHPRACVAEVTLNDHPVAIASWAPFVADLTPFLHPEANRLSVRLYSGNRNLLGPHHHRDGESYRVGPGSFTGTWSWVEKETEAYPATPEEKAQDYWKPGYAFVTFGLEGKVDAEVREAGNLEHAGSERF